MKCQWCDNSNDNVCECYKYPAVNKKTEKTKPHFKISKEYMAFEIEKAINFTLSFGSNILKRDDYESLSRNKNEIIKLLKEDLFK